MKKTVKKLAAIALAAAFTCGALGALVACQPDQSGPSGPRPTPPPTGDYGYTWDYDDDEYMNSSAVYYNNNLGEFYQYYSYAKAADKSLAERYALMAQAEAKLYASAILLPTQANGGNYAVSKVANSTVNSTLWGNDNYRYHNVVVATTPITLTDRQAMRAYWNDSEHATQAGVDYIAWVKSYLSEHGYTTKSTYNMAYTADPRTWDVLATSNQSDSEPVIQTYDGLIEYDVKNQMQPAMAKSIPTPVAGEKAVNPIKEDADGNPLEEDTVTFTFEIRAGQQWVNNQGQKVADFKASDFATGFQHMLDAQGGLEYLVDGVVVGAHEYMDGTAEFSEVGVTADDDAMTVTYQVYQSAESYFLTMLGYSAFAPLSKTYYESRGGKFGEEYAPEADTYLYAKDYDSIAYCGPFLISEHTQRNKITFTKNDNWWNSGTANARNVDTINWFYNDSTDASKSYTDFKTGTIDGCGLVGANVASAKEERLTGDEETIFDKYAYTSAMDATAFCGFLNLNRAAYANVNDPTKVVSAQTAEEKERTNKAMGNVDFRRALVTSIDRVTYMAQVIGPDLAENGISNMYTPGSFVQLPDAVTLTIGDEEKTYPAGTMYGRIVQDQLDADGIQITVWKEVDGAYTYTGFDGWYNATYAKSELAKAVTALEAEGVTIDAEHPIKIDYPYVSSNTYYAARAAAFKQGIAEVLEGKVEINLVSCGNSDEWQDAGYTTNFGYESNYDFYDLAGWGPDYGDPQTYLDTWLPDGNGFMAKCIGIF